MTLKQTTIEELKSYLDAYKANPLSCNEWFKKLIGWYTWLRLGHCKIHNPLQQLIPLLPNLMQLIQINAALKQAQQHNQIRLIIGKARKGGTSSLWRSWGTYCSCFEQNHSAMTITHRTQTTTELAYISKTMAKNMPIQFDPLPELLSQEHKYLHSNSKELFLTAGGEGVGAGLTLNYLHLSECAKYKLNKESTIRDTKIAARWAHTIIIESTFVGQDEFWLDYQKARIKESDYTALFVPWFYDARCTKPLTIPFEPTKEEEQLIALANAQGCSLTPSQLNWRRSEIQNLGDNQFRQECPSTPEEATTAAEGQVLPPFDTAIIRKLPFALSKIPKEELVGGIDIGYGHPTVILHAVYRQGTIYVIDVWRATETLSAERAKNLKENYTYYCDPAELESRKELQREAQKRNIKCQLLAAPRKHNPGQDTQSFELGLIGKRILGGTLKILETASKQLIIEQSCLFYDKQKGTPLITSSPLTGHFDSIFALKYLCMGIQETQWTSWTPPEYSTRKEQLKGL